MARNPLLSMLLGGLAGALVALGLVAYFGGTTALGSVAAVPAGANSAAAEPTFVATQGAMWLLVLFCGALGGIVIASLTYGLGRTLEPDASRFPLRFLLPGAALLAAAMSYAAVRLGVTLGGDVTADGAVVVPVTWMIVTAVVAGVIAGATTTPIVDALARPASIGPRNDATPVSSRAFWSDLMGAVGVPVLAAVIVAALAIGFSQLLLTSGSPIAAVAAFAVVAAVILGATSLIALRPWEK
jgi:hypothetical protein